MRYTVIGYREEGGIVSTLRIFDNWTNSYLERQVNQIVSDLRAPSKVNNVEYTNKLNWTSGSASRYPKICRNGIIQNKGCGTIVDRFRCNDTTVYKVVDVTGRWYWCTENQVAQLNSKAPITNCKVYEKDGTIVVQHIGGDFESNKVDEVCIREVMNKKILCIPENKNLQALDLENKVDLNDVTDIDPSFFRFTVKKLINPNQKYILNLDNLLFKNLEEIESDGDLEIRIICDSESGDTNLIDTKLKSIKAKKRAGFNTRLRYGSIFEFSNLSNIEAKEFETNSSAIRLPKINLDTLMPKFVSTRFNIDGAYTESGTLVLPSVITNIDSKCIESLKGLNKVRIESHNPYVGYSRVWSEYSGTIEVPEFCLSIDRIREGFPKAYVTTYGEDISKQDRNKLSRMSLLGMDSIPNNDAGLRNMLNATPEKNVKVIIANALKSGAGFKFKFGPFNCVAFISHHGYLTSPKIYEDAIQFRFDKKIVVVPFSKRALLAHKGELYSAAYYGEQLTKLRIPEYDLGKKGTVKDIVFDESDKQLNVIYEDGEVIMVGGTV